MGTLKVECDVHELDVYPKNIYPASVDPMHFSHRETLLLAEQQIGEEVHLLICRNDMKSKGVFPTKERLRLAQIMLPGRKIYVAASKKEVCRFIHRCARVVRGVRGIEDEVEMEKLAKHYSLEAQSKKVMKVKVAANFREISSTRLKALVASGDISSAEQFTCPEIVHALHEQYLRQNHETKQMHERKLFETIQSNHANYMLTRRRHCNVYSPKNTVDINHLTDVQSRCDFCSL